MYQYNYPHPAVTADVVAFTADHQGLKVLLIKRDDAPYNDRLALPGGFVRIDEALEDAAYRVLSEKTPLKQVYIEQLYTFGNPGRDPRERVVSVVYMAIIPINQIPDNIEQWYLVDALQALAFDHNEIISLAKQRLSSKLQYSSIVFRFLAAKFTLTEVQKMTETILGKQLEKRNFRKQLLAKDILIATAERSRAGSHRPAQLYTLKSDESLHYW